MTSHPVTVGVATRAGTTGHNCDAARTHTRPDGTIAAALIDGTGNTPNLANLVQVLAEVAARIGARRGGMAGLITAGELIADGIEEAAAVLAVIDDEGPATVWWIGDCRAYRWDGTNLRQHTTDHTMGAQLRASGGVPVDLAATHDHWLLIGLSSATAATVRQVWIPDHGQDLGDDLVLLTTDGVHDQVDHDMMAGLVADHCRDSQRLADALVQAAEGDGGYRDDATAVVLVREVSR